jgi:NAD dependent epimerase/dehydratase family enzyme
MASDWEESAQQFKQIGSRVIQMRISLLMNQETAFLKYNLISMKLGIGVIIGSKEKKISWIHVDDAANFIKESITNSNYKGVYNLATTEPISQGMFIKKIKDKLYPYALIIKIPFFLVRLFLGKRSHIINTDLSINVDKLKKEGFIWKFYNLNEVLDKVRK